MLVRPSPAPKRGTTISAVPRPSSLPGGSSLYCPLLLSLRAPPLRLDWFDARHNKKCKHLKNVTVDFVFDKDGSFVPGLQPYVPRL